MQGFQSSKWKLPLILITEQPWKWQQLSVYTGCFFCFLFEFNLIKAHLLTQKTHSYEHLISQKKALFIFCSVQTLTLYWSDIGCVMFTDMLGVWCEDLGRLLLLRHQKQRNDTQKTGGYPGGPANKLTQMNQLNPMNQLNQLSSKYVHAFMISWCPFSRIRLSLHEFLTAPFFVMTLLACVSSFLLSVNWFCDSLKSFWLNCVCLFPIMGVI